jgi:NADH-quinone oxidoreductase subunit F
MGDIEKLVNVANGIEGRTICALGEAAAWPVQSFVKHFHQEFVDKIKLKHTHKV